MTERGPELKAVLFDLDGTLYDRDTLVEAVVAAQFETFRDHLAGVDQDVFVERVFTLDAHGYGDKAALYAQIIREWGLPLALAHELERDFWERYVSNCEATPDTVHTLRRLEEGGLKLGVITNGSARLQADKLASLGVSAYFDAVLISEVEGVRKPDPVIFGRALARCGVAADEAAFVGDSPEADVYGAKAAGLLAIWKRVPYWEMTDPTVPTIDSLSEILPLCLGADARLLDSP